VPPKRPLKVKQSVAKLRGVDRDRALHAAALVEDGWGREPADLVAFVNYPLDDEVSTSSAFANEIGSLSMDAAAFAQDATPGAAVHAAAMAVQAFFDAAQSHDETYYVNRYQAALIDAPNVAARFGD
jgi:hypothetical protein